MPSATIPAALATAAAVGGVSSAIIGGVGAIQSANAQKSAAQYNSQVAANNAIIANQNATFAGEEGEQQAAQSQAKTRAEVGAIAANQGASGIDVNSGSAVDVRSSASEVGELNAINIRANAARQAYGFQTQAASDTGQSALDRSAAASDQTAGGINASSTILGGLGQAGSAYGRFLSDNSPVDTSFSGGVS